MRDANEALWWRRSRALGVRTLVGFTLFAVAPLLLAGYLDSGSLFGLPFGAFLASVGVPVILAMAAFWFAERQQGLDRQHHITDD